MRLLRLDDLEALAAMRLLRAVQAYEEGPPWLLYHLDDLGAYDRYVTVLSRLQEQLVLRLRARAIKGQVLQERLEREWVDGNGSSRTGQ
jgi:hypothetical protein